MKIALINSRQSDTPVAPLGLLHNAACLLEHNFEVHLFDPFFDNRAYIKRLAEIKPDLIGLSILTSSYATAKNQLSLIKEILPEAIFCAGGVHVTSLPEDTLNDLDLDFVVMGEGELTIVEACKRLSKGDSLEGLEGVCYRDGGGIAIKNEGRELIKELDQLPHPAWHLLPMDKYLIPPGYIRSYFSSRTIVIFATRGCPWACIYCSSNITFGRQVRYHSVEYVIDGLVHLIKEYNIDSFYFFDDTITVNEKWVKDFCELKLRRGIKLKWGCQSRVDRVDDELVKAMSAAGCVQIDFGIESGSQKVLDEIKKGTTVEQAENAFALCKKHQIRPYASVMIGNPGEEEKDVLLTASLLKRIKPVYTSVCYTQPMPGSKLYSLGIKNEWFVDDKSYRSDHWDFRKTIEPLMTIKIDKKKQMELRSKLQNQSFIRNYGFFLSLKTIPFIFELIITFALKSGKILKSIRKIFKSGKIDDFVDELILEHRKRLILKRTKHDYEM
jgi:radical SAM superfamily enzyme YgiQ (UPF0313 family)